MYLSLENPVDEMGLLADLESITMLALVVFDI